MFTSNTRKLIGPIVGNQEANSNLLIAICNAHAKIQNCIQILYDLTIADCPSEERTIDAAIKALGNEIALSSSQIRGKFEDGRVGQIPPGAKFSQIATAVCERIDSERRESNGLLQAANNKHSLHLGEKETLSTNLMMFKILSLVPGLGLLGVLAYLIVSWRHVHEYKGLDKPEDHIATREEPTLETGNSMAVVKVKSRALSDKAADMVSAAADAPMMHPVRSSASLAKSKPEERNEKRVPVGIASAPERTKVTSKRVSRASTEQSWRILPSPIVTNSLVVLAGAFVAVWF